MKSLFRGRVKIGSGVLNVSAQGTVSAATTIASPFHVVSVGTAAWNAGTVANGTVTTTTQAVTGATVGDAVVVGVPIDLKGCGFSAYVASAGTVTVAVYNSTGASQTLGTAASNWKLQVQRIA